MVVDAVPSPAAERHKAERLRRLWKHLPWKPNERLDDTATLRRRSEDGDAGTFRASGTGVNFPTGLLLYLIAQLIAGVWWGATMQSKVDHGEVDRAREEQRLWDSINNYHLEINALRIDVARVQGAQSIQIRPSRGKEE